MLRSRRVGHREMRAIRTVDLGGRPLPFAAGGLSQTLAAQRVPLVGLVEPIDLRSQFLGVRSVLHLVQRPHGWPVKVIPEKGQHILKMVRTLGQSCACNIRATIRALKGSLTSPIRLLGGEDERFRHVPAKLSELLVAQQPKLYLEKHPGAEPHGCPVERIAGIIV